MSDNTKKMRQALWFFNHNHELALPCDGTFIEALIRAICRADEKNRDRLYQEFPALVWAVHVIRMEPDGYDQVARQIRDEEGAPL